ncbi:MAG: PEP-utilizing enzyme [Dehalococcoidia bacterium]|nr:PEP-utilizing enzyme [Dehalococcoidia bacterium]
MTFDLPGPEYEEVTWIHNEHGSSSSSPLSRTARVPSAPPAAGDELPRQISVNSYGYSRADDWPLKSTLPFHLQDGELPEDDGDILDWRERCLPLVDEVVAEIDGFDPASVVRGAWRGVIEAQQSRFSEVSTLVHGTAVYGAQIFAEVFAERYVREFGAERQAEGLALLQGFSNISTDRAADLWDLGRIARRSAAVMLAIESGALPPGNDNDEVAAEFRDGFESALDRYGHMNPLGMEDTPTWREDISVPLSMIWQYGMEGDDRSPRIVEQVAMARRRELEAELTAAADESPAAAELIMLLPYAQHIGPVTEDHNLLADQMILNASRNRWLKVGEMLLERGGVEDASDVFYYEFDELLELLENNTPLGAKELAARKEQIARWRSVIPPAVIGKGARIDHGTGAEIVVTGMAAAAGSYTGRARVVRKMTEANVLEEGDVLVCDITIPAWTPYFAVIGAVVTNIGSILAHGAIVAREFGIPAVVATGDGTSVIPDGAIVTVDGTAGTVTVVGD